MWGATRQTCRRLRWSYCFNSRTPCGVRLLLCCSINPSNRFQFTHPVWGATGIRASFGYKDEFQFTHPVWGATPATGQVTEPPKFQFTHPVWGATIRQYGTVGYGRVSIHAPRVGCDNLIFRSLVLKNSFNSRTPCGVRRRGARGGGAGL